MRSLLLCLLLASTALVVPLTGCASQEERLQADEAAIEAFLSDYLPNLATAYSTRDTTPVVGFVAERERASIEKRIADISAQGRVLRATFRELTVEDVDVWSHANAYVTTLEVWDLESLAAGSETVVASEIGQATRVKYQLKRQDGEWRILFRAIQDTA